MAWTFLVTITAKVAALGSQVVLGWKLAPTDFGLYATAISVSAIVTVLKDGGCGRLLVQKGHRYVPLARPVFAVSLSFNALVAAVLCVMGPILERTYQRKGLAEIMILLSVSTILSTPSGIARSALMYRMMHRDIARVAIQSVLLQHLLAVAFAICGLGVLSLVLPLLFQNVFEWYRYRTIAGPLPSREVSQPLDRLLLVELFRDARWILLLALALALVGNGDYLVLGIVVESAVLGAYFFAYQLSAAISNTITGSISGVLMPAFVRLVGEPQRLATAYESSLRSLALVSAPICVGAALVTPAIVHNVWDGKWDDSIPVAQLLVVALIFRLNSPVSRALLEAAGKWRLVAFAYLGDGILLMIVVALVATRAGDLPAIGTAVATYRAIGGMALLWVAAVALGLRGWSALRQTSNAIVSLMIGSAVWWSCGSLGWDSKTWGTASQMICAFLPLQVCAALLLQRRGYMELRARLLPSKRSRRKAAKAA